jgi:hypothetical protein
MHLTIAKTPYLATAANKGGTLTAYPVQAPSTYCSYACPYPAGNLHPIKDFLSDYQLFTSCRWVDQEALSTHIGCFPSCTCTLACHAPAFSWTLETGPLKQQVIVAVHTETCFSYLFACDSGDESETDPDEEECEGYTGNEGLTVE